jgi:hypothetical protein
VHVSITCACREQCKKLRTAFVAVLGQEKARDVSINTIDAFQGKEVDVAIMSCVRASGDPSLGDSRSLLGKPSQPAV